MNGAQNERIVDGIVDGICVGANGIPCMDCMLCRTEDMLLKLNEGLARICKVEQTLDTVPLFEECTAYMRISDEASKLIKYGESYRG